jgi:hypothetical protein
LSSAAGFFGRTGRLLCNVMEVQIDTILGVAAVSAPLT